MQITKMDVEVRYEESYPLSREEFNAWLQSKDTDEVVGLRTTCKNCPIANALKQGKYKFQEVFINVNYGENKEGETTLNDWITFENPAWVNSFVDKVDHLAGETPKITAKRALEILSEIENDLLN